MSNVPFLWVSGMGFWASLNCPRAFAVPSEKWAFLAFFTGVFLTAFGSGYFHWNPSTDTLLWDRLPMGILFMGFVVGILSDHLGAGVGRIILIPSLVAGIGSVLWWYFSEQRGAGDLRPYGIVQFGPMVFLPAVLAFHASRYTHARMVWLIAGLYVLAKIFEHFDSQVFSAVGIMSGHSIKHLVTAAAAYYVAKMLSARNAV